MRLLRSAVLYAALALGANAAMADIAAVEALREGDMKKLNFHSEPQPVSEAVFFDADGAEVRLSDYRGRWILLNFWATWCAPCRKEMPALDALEAELGGEGFAVLTVATGRNPVPAIRKFYAEAGVSQLPILRDPKQELARGMAVMGLPITMILNPEGQEVARLMGDADWASDSARAVLTALMAE